MTATRLLADLRQRGVKIVPKLRVEAPAGILRPEERQALAEYRDDLLRLLILGNAEGLRLLSEGFLERAAIREHDGKLPRDEAEQAALGDVLNLLR